MRTGLARLAAMALLASLASPDVAAAATRPLPVMVQEGPYGDPFATAPPLTMAGLAFDDGWRVSSFGADAVAVPTSPERREIVPGLKPPGPAATTILDPNRDDGTPARPGTFKPAPTSIPAPPTQPQKSMLVAPRTPDVQVQISKRTSVGLFGEVGRVEVDRSGALPSVKTHDVGAGFSLQYRFGQ